MTALQHRTGTFWGPLSRLGLGVCAATFIADQAHKAWFLWAYQIVEGQRLRITPFLDYAYVKNRGISYGLFSQGSMTGQYLLALFALVATVALGVWLARLSENRLLAISLGLIMGGALGNGLDRILHGGVVDYISLHAFGYYWYVFNIADVAIVAGVVGLLYDSFWPSRAQKA